jgi:hypothetical protein
MSDKQTVVEEIKALEAQFIAGVLTSAELKELLEDIKQTKVISVAADDLALKSQLNELIEGIITGAGAVL